MGLTHLTPIDIRQVALDAALKLAANYGYDAGEVVKSAAKIEAYLRNGLDDQPKAAEPEKAAA